MILTMTVSLAYEVAPSGSSSWEEIKKKILDELDEGLRQPTVVKNVTLVADEIKIEAQPSEEEWAEAKRKMVSSITNIDALTEFRIKLHRGK